MLLGLAYFRALRWTTDLIVNGGSPVLALALSLGRLIMIAAGFYLAVLFGGLALLAALAGVLAVKTLMLRRNKADRAMNSPLDSTILFQLGPVPITQAVVTTWAIMAVLVLGAALLTRRLALMPTKRQAALELMVATLDTQITETTGASPAPYRAFIGTLFLFILIANWSSLVPGVEPPTAQT